MLKAELLKRESALLLENPLLTLEQKMLLQNEENQSEQVRNQLLDKLNDALVASYLFQYELLKNQGCLNFSKLGLTRITPSLLIFLQKQNVTLLNFSDNRLLTMPEMIFKLPLLEGVDLRHNDLNPLEIQKIAAQYGGIEIDFMPQKQDQNWEEVDLNDSQTFTPRRQTFEMTGPGKSLESTRQRNRKCNLL